MKLTRRDLKSISYRTLRDYNQRAESFRNGTRHHDVDQNRQALLRHIDGDAPFTIHDFGCGPGRYGAFHDLETWCHYLRTAGFVELTHYYRPDDLPREQQPWLATVWRKQVIDGCPSPRASSAELQASRREPIETERHAFK